MRHTVLVARNAVSLNLTESDRQQLIRWTGAFGTPQQVALRCRIALAAAEGDTADQIAAKLDMNRKTVMLWRARFQREGLKDCGRWLLAPADAQVCFPFLSGASGAGKSSLLAAWVIPKLTREGNVVIQLRGMNSCLNGSGPDSSAGPNLDPTARQGQRSFPPLTSGPDRASQRLG